MVFIRKGICMLFIVTEILCYIFAILFPPPNKSFPQITNPFPYRPLSKLGLSTYPRVSFLSFLCVCLVLYTAQALLTWLTCWSGQLALCSLTLPTQKGLRSSLSLPRESGTREGKGQGWGPGADTMSKC